MKRKRHTPEDIIKKLREAATLLAGGQGIEEVCKKLEVSPPTYHRWRQEYGGAKEETIKRLKLLEKEPSGARCQKGGAFCPKGSAGGCWQFIALAVQDWIARRGFKTLYIKPGAPWQNAYSESFNSRFRDEFLNREAFASVLEAKMLGKQHRHRHNHQRPHSSLDYQTPVEFAQRSLAAASATLRQPQGCALSPEHQTHNQTPETNQKLS